VKYDLPKEFIERYSAMLASPCMSDVPDYSKSEYWKFHASQVDIKVGVDSVEAKGKSGFYVASSRNLLSMMAKLITLIKTPSKVVVRIKQKLRLPVNGIKLLSYSVAFNKTMGAAFISQPQLSPYRINFSALAQHDYIFSSVDDCKKDYAKVSLGREFSDHIVMAYYYLNFFNHYVGLHALKKSTILEIGGGNGNLSSVLKWHTKNATIIDVDLPETLSHAILYIGSLFPSAKILMPNEIEITSDLSSYDFVFLTPTQLHFIADSSVDLAINTHSFQEMTHLQIDDYFKLIQRAGKADSIFFTSNRVEKLPSGEGSFDKETAVLPNRFANYPWSEKNKVKVFEVCKLFRLVQLDSVFNRLEVIKK
jgi:putative sugar O-methyltransferase